MASSGTIGKFNTGGNDYLIASTAFGTCDTPASGTIKYITIQDSAPFTPIAGITIYVKFTYGNYPDLSDILSSSRWLNINMGGAIQNVYGTLRWGANEVVSFTFDGTAWRQNDAWSDIYMCKYGATTQAQIRDALSDGKLPICKYGDAIYVYSEDDGYNIWFSSSTARDEGAVHPFSIDTVANITGSTWQSYSVNATKTITSSSTHVEIPTAKAVYDSLQNISAGVDSTDTSNKIYLIGAETQGTGVDTYSDNQVYATNGQLDANKLRVAEQVTMQYNSTTEALDFVFA